MLVPASILAVSVHILGALSQGHNTVYSQYPNVGTLAMNSTAFILPVPKSTLARIVTYPFLPLPSYLDATIPDGSHPVLVEYGYQTDIRQAFLQIPGLMYGRISVPYIDRLKDGKSPFSYWHQTFTSELIPSLVASTLDNVNDQIAIFSPEKAAFELAGGIFQAQVLQGLQLPDGPGPVLPAIDAFFTRLASGEAPVYEESVYQNILSNEAFYGPLGCGQFLRFYNSSDAQPFHVNGNVTLYGSHWPETTTFTNLPGLSVSTQVVMNIFPPQPCTNFAQT